MKTNNDVAIRALAVLLVLNSHLDPFYTNKMLSGGGALANALFFFLSGVGISATSTLNAPLNLWATLKHAASRIPRIYAPAWVVGLLLTLFQVYQFEDAQDFIQAVIWPTRYWFLYALVLFYPLVLLTAQSIKRVALVFFMLLVAYTVWYTIALDLHRFSVEDYYFRWITYLGLMLFGTTLKLWTKPSRSMGIVFLFVATVTFITVKLALSSLQVWDWQFLLSALLFPFVYGAYWSLKDVTLPLLLSKLASFLARHSLEIYVIQMPIIFWIAEKQINGLTGVTLVAITTFALAPVLRRVCRFTQSR